jgi:hypothetical protein
MADGGDPQAMSLWGGLTLQRAVVAARINDPDTAYDQLERAKQMAGRLGEGRNDYNTEFGPANVGLQEVAIAVDLGDAGRALRAAASVDTSGLSAERRARLLIEVARARAQRRQALAAQLRVSYAKVAEYQRRGVVHFHAIIRLDGPNGPNTAPPAWATVALLTIAIDQAVRAVSVRTPAAPGLPARTLAWGRQLEIRPVTASGDVTDTQVAGYVAKYATKAAECTGTLDRRLTPADRIADLPVRENARRHIAACLRLGKLPQLKDLRLAAWAHMLGFRGHFSTKSRTYSITLGSLRADRAAHQREYAIAAGLQPDLDPGTTLVLTD